jgi:hypothetical protein
MFFFDLICFFFGFKDGWIFVNGFLSQIGEFTNAMPLKLVSTLRVNSPVTVPENHSAWMTLKRSMEVC